MGAYSALWGIPLSVSVLYALLAWYIRARVSSTFALSPRARRFLACALGAGLVCELLSRMLGNARPAHGFGLVGAVMLLGVAISSLLLVPAELLRLALRATPVAPARRQFIAQLASGGALAAGGGTALYGTLFGRRDYTVETVPIALAKLPRTLDGFTIVQLSDLHVGTFIGERELAAALSLVRDAKPDLVVLTGDLIDHDARYAPLLGQFGRALSSLARYGAYAIPGNHDFYGGRNSVNRVLGALAQGGTQVLRDRHVRIGDAGGSFVLAGVDDVASRRYGGSGPRPELAFEGADPELARVLLSHNPVTFSAMRAFADLTLSGHTHGGQITLFVNPAALLLRHGRIRGHYTSGDAQLYVNRGFGTAGPPTRVGSPPEVTKLILTRS